MSLPNMHEQKMAQIVVCAWMNKYRWLLGWLVEFWCTHSCDLSPLINLVKSASPTRKVFLKDQIKLLEVVLLQDIEM